ncbi:hypothetical protein [Methylorubrum sp. SL192]|uniref:hypothetical protein n=1 Tax=Methylorubrum sp. SL192 TaxID=2995167 RepID=UPI0006FE4492|nr:hypothetical protein [Methylorubrum sp. SL192]KQO89454.1 hypothetical protein ASF33_19175 [Methylobacterium sp. Leaf92]MCY1644922.1 hypothetical protein [Methylorubrum sp. SL192]
MTDRVICETCGEDTWSEQHPCSNCDRCPPTSNWGTSFPFDQALLGMRLSKRVRRPGWDRTWSIEDGKLTVRWPDPAGGEDAVALACELHEDDILADYWEVAQ